MHILTLCLGNICRSPAAEAVLRHMARARGQSVTIDSCGTGDWHVGNPPYGPMIAAAKGRGYDLRPLRARQLDPGDYHRFDLILAMDRENLADLRAAAPECHRAKLRLFLDAPPHEVPDPYFTRNFEEALDLIEAGSARLLDQLG